MKYGKFVFDNKELVLDEYDLIILMKMCKVRNKALYKKFEKFYLEIVSEDTKSIFDKLFND